VKIDPRL